MAFIEICKDQPEPVMVSLALGGAALAGQGGRDGLGRSRPARGRADRDPLRADQVLPGSQEGAELGPANLGAENRVLIALLVQSAATSGPHHPR
jgi:hypothetical protein